MKKKAKKVSKKRPVVKTSVEPDGLFGTGDIAAVTVRESKDGKEGFMDITFKSKAAARRFERLVADKYGAKEYTPELATRFMVEALGFAGDK